MSSLNELISQKLVNCVHPRKAAYLMAQQKNDPPIDNVISDQTGQFDLRFVLWRHFCSQQGIPVETLPSQLSDQQKEDWEELKASRLRGPGQK